MKKKKTDVVWMLILMLYLLLPLVVTFIYSISRKWTALFPEGIHLENYRTLFLDSAFLQCIVRSIILCIIPIIVTTIAVLLALFTVLVYFPKLEKYIQIICMIPYTIQGVILSVCILSLYVDAPSILHNRMVMLIGAYCVIILPYIYQGIRNGMRAINMHTLLEASQMLGASKIGAFFEIIVPNIISAITVSSLLAVGIIFGDYVLIRNLAGTANPNMQIYLYQTMKADSTKSSAVFVIIMFVTFVITAAVLYAKGKETTGRKHKKKEK